MNSIINNFIKKNKNQCIAVLLNAFFLVYSFGFFLPIHETNDDVFYEDLLSGAYTVGTNTLVFVNYYLALVFRMFYKIIPCGNVYGIICWTMVFLSFVILTYLILEHTNNIVGIMVSVALLWIFHSQFYLILQFTRVTFITSLAGYCLILHCIKQRRNGYLTIILGGGLIVFGALLRQNAFFEVSAFCGIYGIADLLVGECKEDILRHIKRTIVHLLPIYVIIFSCYYLDGIKYKQYGWTDFLEYNQVRANLQDFGWPEYEEYEEEYKKLGVSYDDYRWYLTNNIGDDSVLTTDIMKEIADMKVQTSKKISLSSVLAFVRSYLVNNTYSNIIIILYVLSWLYVKNKKYLVPLTMIFLLENALFYWYFLSERVVERVLTPTLFCTMYLMILFFVSNVHFELSPRDKRRAIPVMALFMVVSNPVAYGTYNYLYAMHMDDSEIESVFNDKENLYVADHNIHGRSYFYYDAYHRAPEDLYSNQILPGGWLTRSPVSNEHNTLAGVTNFCEELINNEKCYFYTKDNGDLLGKYLRRHYDSSTAWTVYRHYTWFDLYDYSTNVKDYVIRDDIKGEYCTRSDYDRTPDKYIVQCQIKDLKKDEIKENSKIYFQVKDKNNEKIYTYRCFEDEIDEDGVITAIIPTIDKWCEGDDCEYVILIKSDNNVQGIVCE